MATSGSSESRSKEGFTLIEMIVTVAILGLLISILGVSAPINRENFLLATNQEELRDLITRAKSLALNGAFVVNPNLSNLNCGYGVHIDDKSSTAFIFEACGVTTSPTQNASAQYAGKSGSQSALGGSLNEVSLDKSLALSITVDDNGSESNPGSADIFFLPPDPLVFINGASSQSGSVVIGISSPNNVGGSGWGVSVNSVGLIEPLK